MQEERWKELFDDQKEGWDDVQEVRIRVNRPVIICRNGIESQLDMTADSTFIKEFLSMISGHSLYVFEDEIRRGFLTIEGGHRIGIAGKVVMDETGIRTIKDISSLTVRLARACPGCADEVLPWLYKGGAFQNALFLSPPGAGKTTMLRDVIRQISDGTKYGPGMAVSVVDERSEIAACFRGVPQCDLGMRTDVMDGCPKALGMLMMIRSMAPSVVAVDEIGTDEDLRALRAVMKCGCGILATVHGTEVTDLKKKRILREMAEEGMFERYVVLSKDPSPGTVTGIYDGAFQRLWGQ